MPVQPSPEQPARPTPVAVAPLPSRHRHLLQVPEATWADCGFGLVFFFVLKILQGKGASPSLCTLTLRNFPQAACSPQHRSAMTAWETWAGKEEGEKTGGRRVLPSCCLALLVVRPFPRPVGAAERMQIRPRMRTYRRRSCQRRGRIRKEGGNFGRTGSDRKRRQKRQTQPRIQRHKLVFQMSKQVAGCLLLSSIREPTRRPLV